MTESFVVEDSIESAPDIKRDKSGFMPLLPGSPNVVGDATDEVSSKPP